MRLYGVETKHVNQAVSRNQEKFRKGYLIPLEVNKLKQLRSQNVTANVRALKRDIVVLHEEKDADVQKMTMQRFSDNLAEIVAPEFIQEENFRVIIWRKTNNL